MINGLINHAAVAAALASPDGWRGSFEGRPTFFERQLFEERGYKVTLHRFVAADAPDCFHSHPATAIRMVLSGGYEEELFGGGTQVCAPGFVGIVDPNMTHRVHRLLNGSESVSLWVRLPVTDKIQLIGSGWHRTPAKPLLKDPR